MKNLKRILIGLLVTSWIPFLIAAKVVQHGLTTNAESAALAIVTNIASYRATNESPIVYGVTTNLFLLRTNGGSNFLQFSRGVLTNVLTY